MLALGSFICCFSDRKNWEVEGLLYPFHLYPAWAEECNFNNSLPKWFKNFKLINLGLTFLKTFMIKVLQRRGDGGTQFGDGSLPWQNPGYRDCDICCRFIRLTSK
jgi:hypothetical protein